MGNETSLVTLQLRGSAAGLAYLHSRGVVHGNGEFDRHLTSVHDLTSSTVSCVSSLDPSPRESPLTEGTWRNVLVSLQVGPAFASCKF